MTLLREIMLVVVAIFVALFSANFVLTVLESRNYLETQMQAHAQDTATSLGVSMTTALAEQDSANLELLASAVFDRGYYSEIKLTSIDGELLVDRENTTQIDDVPSWFVDLLDLPNPEGRSSITQGWIQLGELSVRAHPGSAYRDLWRITIDFAYLFGAIIVLSYGIFGAVISFVMRPLKEVEAQANDICERKFAIVENIPRTRELKRVVEAMNRTSRKLKEMFESQLALTEKLRFEAKTDHVTGLTNRQEFDSLVNEIIESEEGPGTNLLMLLQIRDFAEVNERLGFVAADELLSQIADRLTGSIAQREGAILSRRAGADFAVFIPNISLERSRLDLQRAFNEVASLRTLTEAEFSNALHMSAVFAEEVTPLTDLLSEADASLRNASFSSSNDIKFQIYGSDRGSASELGKQATEWRATLKEILDNEAILFHYQPIYNLAENGAFELFANEAYVRVELNGRVITAGTFIPMAERFGMLAQLDQLIITRMLASLTADSPDMVLNLSTFSLQQESFRSWLLKTLASYPEQSKQLIFEIQEHAVQLGYEVLRDTVDAGNDLGCRFSIDHFGASSASFSYLQSLDLSYIKINRSFVSQIDTQVDNQFFVQSAAQIAHARDILVMAEGIERLEELETLRTLRVDSAMGYLLGRPGPQIIRR
jgi:diguanylate cyclase (GGDEF)-like protein